MLALVVCFVTAAEEAKSSSVQSEASRSKRGYVVGSPYAAIATPYAAAAAPYVASPYVASPYVAAPYAAAPYAVAAPYASPYVSSYTAYPYVAKTVAAAPYAYYPWTEWYLTLATITTSALKTLYNSFTNK